MNKILCFDVSNNSCSVAIAAGQEILSFEQNLAPSVQAEKLLVIIESVLEKAQMQYEDLDYLAVTVGPGSFTGIRIGLAAAKGILYASGVKGVAITNFEASFYRLKMQVKEFDSAVIMLNAYRNQLYVQQFSADGAKSKPDLMDIVDVKDYLQKQSGKVICAGSGLKEIYEQVKDIENITCLPRFPSIRAIHLARYADDKINMGEINPIEPLYIRPPDAIPPK
jgi:tRNA threonylcarbamoyl adenosine modification protein YeaZ